MLTLFINHIHDSFSQNREIQSFVKKLKSREVSLSISGLKGALEPIFLHYLACQKGRPLLIVTADESSAIQMSRDLSLVTEKLVYFPWWGGMLYRGVSPQASLFGERVNALKAITTGHPEVIVVSLNSYLSLLPPVDYFNNLSASVTLGSSFDPVALAEKLVNIGYMRVPKVSIAGEMALRGEVLDIVLPGESGGVRIQFGFDEVEQIRLFDPLTQISSAKIEKIEIPPMKEVVWDETLISSLSHQSGLTEESITPFIDSLREGITLQGEELFYPCGFEERTTIRDYLPKGSLPVFLGVESFYEKEKRFKRELTKWQANAANEGILFPPIEKMTASLDELGGLEEGVSLYTTEQEVDIHLESHRNEAYVGNILYLKESLTEYLEKGFTLYLFAGSESQAKRIEYLLKEFPITVLPERLSEGFILPEQKIMALPEQEIFGRKREAPTSLKQAKSQRIDSFVDLSPGDIVVHINYGIGRFSKIDRIRVKGNERDYISLEYAQQERIFIPVEQVNLIQRYIGSEGREPKLDRIGGKSWDSRKEKVKKAIEELADKLLILYAKRERIQGFSFPPDSEFQNQFEAVFPYQETEDQLKAIEEVKRDMEAPRPTDRLICGDVGYGKTEIAMRAAFKAVMAGRQVAILCPTTILCEQHFDNFCERFHSFPVKIEMLSRFTPPSSVKRALKECRDGAVDIVIGTHRLLSKDVSFKQLGLMIIDEEQRFGVKDKEKLKELKHSIDCVTLSATPIPRTLYMSLAKIRDMSILNTPPRNRHPIETFIQGFNPELVAKAIRKEMERGGQVFYLHNKIEDLTAVQNFLQELIPEALIEVAHGRMEASRLEEVMRRFTHHGFQVLLSTTIIENGIDIPNVNTIIIDRADTYGISQLYQLRGRVGRSDRVAYAYLFYPQQKALSELAMKRLQIISDFTELGSGFKIAMKDLEVRGAGNLLGREQSGEIFSVGLDLYLKLLQEAVDKREGHEEEEEIYLELDYSGFIPDSYVSDQQEKMDIYKKIASVKERSELLSLTRELEDRFGPPPHEVVNLISLAEIRAICKELKISSLKERQGVTTVVFSKVAHLSVDKVLKLLGSSDLIKLDPQNPNQLHLKTGSVNLKEKGKFINQYLKSLY